MDAQDHDGTPSQATRPSRVSARTRSQAHRFAPGIRPRATPPRRVACAGLLALTTSCSVALGVPAPKQAASPRECLPVWPLTDALIGTVATAIAIDTIAIDRCLENCNSDGGQLLKGGASALAAFLAFSSATYGAIRSEQCARRLSHANERSRRRPIGYAALGVASSGNGGAGGFDGDNAGGAGEANRAIAAEGGFAIPNLPLVLHASAELGRTYRVGFYRSFHESLVRARGGPEFRACGAAHCLLVGFDVGYQDRSLDAGLLYGPRVGLELGVSGRLAVRMSLDTYSYNRRRADAQGNDRTELLRGIGVAFTVGYRFELSPPPAPSSAPLAP